MINWIKNKLHIHWFNKPIVSRYISFSSRDIIFEYRCGKRECRRVRAVFDEPFPIQTSSITSEDFQKELEKGV